MHTINLSKTDIRTDLIFEQKKYKLNTFSNNLKIIKDHDDDYNYITIFYKDITDKDNYHSVKNALVKELKKLITPSRDKPILIIGLGNRLSTPDSLGPKVIENILVTRHLFLLGDVDEKYSNCCSFTPNVIGNTGLESSDVIKSIINDITPSQVIIIDSLKTNTVERLNKTIQISNQGIIPGSGIGNTRKEITKNNMNVEIISIGVPTVIELDNENNNLIVSTCDIDFIIEKLGILIADAINNTIHTIRQNNSV